MMWMSFSCKHNGLKNMWKVLTHKLKEVHTSMKLNTTVSKLMSNDQQITEISTDCEYD